ncbi:MAG: Chitooligosaccharide deacetylase [Alphaproteobacteria bacterium MarineAlpha4_Bin2]|nr:MAG: Chitooligosaccharide deacetylase [Alphaproteobacteria bacterium MarineAlpha4_Bin2]
MVCGWPVLPAREIPDLVDAAGMLDTNLIRAGLRYFFLPKVRRQLAKEIRAQFEAFHESGFALDHVNAHNHMQIHPTVLSLILEIGIDYGMRAMRVPDEPIALPGASTLSFSRRMARLIPWIWLRLMRSRLRRAGLNTNDYVYGIRDSGALVRERMLALLAELPDGVTEIFLHPARGDWDGVEEAARHYRFEEEFQALIDGDVRAAAEASGAKLTAFSGL